MMMMMVVVVVVVMMMLLLMMIMMIMTERSKHAAVLILHKIVVFDSHLFVSVFVRRQTTGCTILKLPNCHCEHQKSYIVLTRIELRIP